METSCLRQIFVQGIELLMTREDVEKATVRFVLTELLSYLQELALANLKPFLAYLQSPHLFVHYMSAIAQKSTILHE